MPRHRPDSLRRLLLWRLGGLVSLVLLLGAGLTFALARHFANGVFDQWLFDSASTLAAQVKATTGHPMLDLPRSAVEMFEFDAVDRVFYDVISADGRRIFGNAALPEPPESATTGVPIFYDATIQGRVVRAVAIRLETAGGEPEAVAVRVAETTNKREALVAQMLLATLSPQVVLLLLAALGIWYEVTTGMRSLDKIAARLAGYRPDQTLPLPLPEPDSAPAEVRPLLLALHNLVGKLGEAQASQQRFIANASHQLRTPLAALQVQAERALREPDPVKHLAALESVLKTMTRLRHLSHQLLMLARSEPVGNPGIVLRQLDLVALARAELEQWTDAALANGADLGYEGPTGNAGIAVDGEPQLLRELIGNLVDNAIRYGGEGSRITLGLHDAGQPVLVVDDDGPGIPETERALVVERFYRRSQSPGDGTGLGLAIAREIAARHGADLRIDGAPGGRGTRVTVTFPRVSTQEPAAAQP
ncbi:MAG: sensor histidine kinase [Betaproteobacteria bacterium]